MNTDLTTSHVHVESISKRLTTMQSTLSQFLHDDITTLPIANQQSIIFVQSNELNTIISTLQLYQQQLDFDHKVREQQLTSDYKMKEQLLDLRIAQFNNREDNLTIKEEQMKVKEARLDLQEKEQEQEQHRCPHHKHPKHHTEPIITTHSASLFEKELLFKNLLPAQIPTEFWDTLEIQQQRHQLDEDRESMLLEYHGLESELEMKRIEGEAIVEKKRKKLSKIQHQIELQMISLLEREHFLKASEDNLDHVIQQRITQQEQHQEQLLQQQQQQEQELRLLNKRKSSIEEQLNANYASFPPGKLTYPDVRYRLTTLNKSTIYCYYNTSTWFALFNDSDDGFPDLFKSDSAAGLLPTEDSRKIYLSSPHVLDGEWVQIWGEGVDPVIDPKTITIGHFLDNNKPHPNTKGIVDDDSEKGKTWNYNYTIEIKWE